MTRQQYFKFSKLYDFKFTKYDWLNSDMQYFCNTVYYFHMQENTILANVRNSSDPLLAQSKQRRWGVAQASHKNGAPGPHPIEQSVHTCLTIRSNITEGDGRRYK